MSDAVTNTLTRSQSGGIILIDGTNNKVINLPQKNSANPGTFYDFIVLTAVATAKTVKFEIEAQNNAASVSTPQGNFIGFLNKQGDNDNIESSFDVSGDTLTLPATTVVGSRGRITCLVDDGSVEASTAKWQVETFSSPVATIA